MMTREKLCACLGAAAQVYPCAWHRFGVYAAGTDKAAELTAMIESEGYALRLDRQVANNSFKLYVKESETVYVNVCQSMNYVRVIVDDRDPLFEGAGDLDTAGSVGMTMMDMDYLSQSAQNNGYGFILTLADGGFVLYDGGYRTQTDDLWSFLKAHTPEGQKPRIEGWVLTHSHGDHYGCFLDFMNRYVDDADLKRVIYGPARRECFTGGTDTTLYERVPELCRDKGVELVLPYTGQILHFPGVDMEVLLTADDLYPEKAPHDNNVSFVTRLEFPTHGGTTVLMPADMMGRGCNRLVDQFGDYLKSDILQVPHHGCNGTTPEIIHAVDPERVIYTTSQRFFEEWTSHSTRGWNNYLMYSCNVKHAYVADNGYQTIL